MQKLSLASINSSPLKESPQKPTGGSPGVDYLDNTTKYRVFRELWAVRTILLPREALPDLHNKELYGFLDEPTEVGATEVSK